MEPDIVDDLLDKPFARRSIEEKLLISNMQVPRPKLENLKSTFARSGKIITRKFNVSSYEAKWLCGSETRGRLFCWPCLLFQNPSDKCVWIKDGYGDLNHLSSAMKGHAATKEHINNAMAHRTFGRTRIDEALDHAHEIARKNHNLLVKKNREGMKTLIDLVCFLGSHGLSFRGHNEGEESVNRGNYKDLCGFIASRDVSFSDFINNNPVFSGTSATIQNELVEVIGSFMIEEIFREVQNAEFVAVMVDETTDVARKSQLATTLRYCLKDGTPVERFVSLDDVSNDKCALALANEVVSLLEKFKVTPEKLVAQTYDGANVMSGVTGGTQAIVKKSYPNADYIHCKAHVLNLVLLHACNHQDTKQFFSTLSTLASFFTQSPKRDSELKNFMQRKIPNVCKVKWAYSSRMVNIIETYHSEITTCLGEMYLGDVQWDGETCSLARGLHSFMLDFKTIFYLKVFSEIFSFTDILYQTLQLKELDYVECGKSVRNARSNINNLQTDRKFKTIWEACLKMTGGKYDQKQYDKYLIKYNSLIKRIVLELDQRFADLNKRGFLSLLDCSKFEGYCGQFPKELIDSTCSRYSNFDKVKLANELRVFYTKEEFAGKKVLDVMKTLMENNLDDIFSETTRLVRLILTLPSTTASVERSFSILRRIKSYLRSTMGEDRLKWLMLMAVENALLHQLQRQSGFSDEIIDRFARRVDRRIPLLYK